MAVNECTPILKRLVTSLLAHPPLIIGLPNEITYTTLVAVVRLTKVHAKIQIHAFKFLNTYENTVCTIRNPAICTEHQSI